MDNQILSFLGLMKKAGDLECGSELAYDAAREHFARLILLSEDAAGNTRAQAKNIAAQFHLPVVTIPVDKNELGAALGMRTCAVAAVTNTGFALSLTQKLGCSEEAILLQEKQEREKRRKQKKLDRAAEKHQPGAAQHGSKAATPAASTENKKTAFHGGKPQGDRRPAPQGDRPNRSFHAPAASTENKKAAFHGGKPQSDRRPAPQGDRPNRPFHAPAASAENKKTAFHGGKPQGDRRPAPQGDRPNRSFHTPAASVENKKAAFHGGKPQRMQKSKAAFRKPTEKRGALNQPRNKGGN